MESNSYGRSSEVYCDAFIPERRSFEHFLFFKPINELLVFSEINRNQGGQQTMVLVSGFSYF